MQVPTTSATTTNPTGQTVNKPKELGKDDFLKLLVTQVRYQDPLKPTEDKEFIAQLAQFSSLEQMQNLNTSFSSLANMQSSLFTASVMGQAVSLIGRQVEGFENEQAFSGLVNGMKIVDGIPKILVDGQEVNISSISKITIPPTTTPEVIA